MNMRMILTGFRKCSGYAAVAGVALVALTNQALAASTLSAASVDGQAGQPAAVQITLTAGSDQIVNLGATFSVVAQGGAPAITDKLTYQAATPPGTPQLTDDTVTGSFAIGYVNDISPPLTATLVVGTLMVPIPGGATGGSYQVKVLNVSALDPGGNDVNISGQAGTITLPVAGNTLSAGNANGQAGQAASVTITMNVGSAQVVNFGATFTVVAQGGAPAITDKLTYQAATPPGAPQLTDDTVTGSFAIGYVNDISPPLTGTLVIGTLMVPIPAGATAGSYQVQALNVSALKPDGNDVTITGQSGTITLAQGPTVTPTVTPTSTPKPNTPTVTPTVKPPNTPTKTPKTPSAGGGGEDHDGCNISSSGSGQSAWLLIIPAAAVVMMRRRRR